MLFEELVEIRDPSPHAAALNMALDEALLAAARVPSLRLYFWERPAVSFGYFGKHAPVLAAWPDRQIVRRMTGGGIVPHGEDLTYSLVVPTSHPLAESSPREVYRTVHEVIAALVSRQSIMPALAGAPRDAGSGVCFESPAEFDLMAHGRKIAGAAMRRTREGLLLQGSIQGIAGLGLLREKLAGVLAAKTSGREFSASELLQADSLAASKYAAREWIERV